MLKSRVVFLLVICDFHGVGVFDFFHGKVVGEEGDTLDNQVLVAAADWAEQNQRIPTKGKSLIVDEIWSAQQHDPPGMIETTYNGSSSLFRLQKGSQSGWTHVIMVNDDYAAAIIRPTPESQWALEAFGEAGTPDYDQMQQNNRRSVPSSNYLQHGSIWLLDLIRSSEIVSSNNTDFEDQEAVQWELRTASGKTMWLITSAEEPYRILGKRRYYGSTVSLVTHSNWVEIDGHYFPQLYEIVSGEGRRKEIVGKRRFDFASRNEWDSNAVRLSYYGLPEPQRGPWSVATILAGIGVVLLVLGGLLTWNQKRNQM